MAELSTISLQRVSRWYGAVIGVNEVTLDIQPGITGLLGPNGAGKSTLMKLVTGQLRPALGDVLVLGQPVAASIAARRCIGFLPEADAFYEELSGRQFVYTMARLSGLDRRTAKQVTEVALDRTGMLDRANKALKGCSKGMRQRIKLAQALVHDPAVLVLDEPLTGIDPPGRVELMALFRALRDEGKTILVSTHILHEVEAITDRIVLMARGRVLAQGTLTRIRELLEDHPLTVRLVSNRRRELASKLMSLDSVAGVALGELTTADDGEIIIKVRKTAELFRQLPAVVTSLGARVGRVEALDASVEAVFGYLVATAGFEIAEGGS